jgi:hypothetical protein
MATRSGSRKTGLIIGLAFAIGFLVVMIYSTMGLSQHRVEVCVEFNGRQDCRIASGATRDEARRTATDNACALLTNGMTESMACSAKQPIKVTWLDVE